MRVNPGSYFGAKSPVGSTTPFARFTAVTSTVTEKPLTLLDLLKEKQPLKIIHGGQVIMPDGNPKAASVVVAGNRIKAVLEGPLPRFLFLGKSVKWIDAQGKIVTPGLVDQHFHGGLGCDLNHPDRDKVHFLRKELPKYGVTSVAPSLLTDDPAVMKSAADALDEEFSEDIGARVLGLHYEGPFLNQNFRGTHHAKYLQTPTVENAKAILNPHLKLMTLAPELDKNLALTRFLSARGVTVQAGHSAASEAQVHEAMQAGVKGVTHLFNAMKPFHHRDTSIANAALSTPGLNAELIADLIHVDKSALQLAIRAKTPLGSNQAPEDLTLVTDSLALTGLPAGSTYNFGGLKVVLDERGRLVNEEGNLSGSSVFLNKCVQNLAREGLAPFGWAAAMASRNPARNLGRNDLGQIKEGALADIVLWDEKTLDVKETLIDGNEVYKSD